MFKSSKRSKKRGQKKQEEVKTPAQFLTQLRRSAGQKFQEMVRTPKQFKTQKYDDADIARRLKKLTG
jgi:hypothetical protein